MATSAAHPALSSRRESCRACAGRRLECFLSLGPTPLVNSFVRGPLNGTPEPRLPLDVYLCEDCSLVQLLEVVDPEVLFRDYVYVTGTSETMAAHNTSYARTLADLLHMGDGDLVVEIASNDGSLLKAFKPYGVRTLGVDPATNLARRAEADGVETVNAFFNTALARQIRERHGRAKAMAANNVLAHVDDPRDLLTGCRELLHPDGLLSVEVPYLGEMLDRLEYDTIYHEHLSYFSAGALLRLCEAAGLSVVRIDRVPVHGGSLRVYAAPAATHPRHAPQAVAMARREEEEGYTRIGRYQAFATAVHSNRDSLLQLLRSLKDAGKTVAAYGAPAKGNVLLNYCGIGTDLVAFTVDRNPLKVGLLTPGTHIPVLPVSELLERRPDYVLILAWNFADEIVRQQHEYHARGGRFIVPVPEAHVIGPGASLA